MTEPECDGRCIYGWELIEGASGVAYPDPFCSLHGRHGHPWEEEEESE